tara:strand:- start:101 stop:1045 length:945 start_codon:yes stop_codon:yes gene_type:complete
MPRTVNEYFQPASTGVHNNIDNLILDAELDKLAQTGSMRADTRPQYIGGVDPIVENIALSPLLTLKRLGTVGKELIEKTGLRNPVSHFTRGESAKDILEAGTIKGASKSFPGQAFKSDRPLRSPSVSITRDPMFLERPHKHVGTDIRFVMDRDELVKKGFKIQPFTEQYFRKVKRPNIAEESGIIFKGKPKTQSWLNKQILPISELKKHGLVINPTRRSIMNPKFEFEERVRGYIPTENIKLIDLIQLPMSMPNKSEDLFKILDLLNKSKIPIIKSPLARERLGKMNPNDIRNKMDYDNVMKLLLTPTYPNSPI